MVLFSNYLSDPRPRRAAEILARQGATVDVICLQASADEPRRETVNGVEYLPCAVETPARRQGELHLPVLRLYFRLVAAAGRDVPSGGVTIWFTSTTCRTSWFSARWFPKILGAKVMLDLHDPMPELMLTIFKLPPESFSVRLLKRLEKWSTAFANVVLTVNLASKRIYSSRSCAPEKIRVVMNSPNERRFPVPATVRGIVAMESPAASFTIMYHGSLLQRNGFDLAVKAMETVRKSIPGAQLVVCGERTPFFDSVMDSAAQRGLQGAINYLGDENAGANRRGSSTAATWASSPITATSSRK